MPKTKIKIADPDENVLLFGITTQLDDYKLSWSINSQLALNLKKGDNYIANKKGISEELIFSTYNAIKNEDSIELISNKTEDSIKLINIPTVDFLLKISSININTESLITDMKKIKGVIAITDIKNNPNIQKKTLKEITDFLK